MNADHFVHLGSALAAAPSRRAVHRALAGLVAGSAFAPLVDVASVAAKKKHKKKKLSKKKFCKKAFGGPVCKKSKSGCCYQGDICTNTPCGCMAKGSTNCCATNKIQPTGTKNYHCPDDHTCCPGKDYDYFPCCPPGQDCCGGDRCCQAHETCCGGVCCPANDCCGGVCCPFHYVCCPDGECRINC